MFEVAKERVAAVRPEVPEPQDEDRNGVGRLEFVRNVAVLPPPAPPAGPPRRSRTLLWALAAGTAGLALGLGAAPAVDWWHDTHPASATGSCTPSAGDKDPRAVLLDHSDALDKKNVDHEKVEGLSSLALVSQGQDVTALALADNSPGRIFPLTLGTPFDLDPTADRAKTLRRADGTAFPDDDWYDGEALVIEKGGKTVLVGSPTRPPSTACPWTPSPARPSSSAWRTARRAAGARSPLPGRRRSIRCSTTWRAWLSASR
ncbi:hypothetical protein GCM10010129_27410 [Streptomyces fumigatiscleroticus]|nr:hypothetical protein GCM10010129_27410 [Streptomyces fumigatiscleroticus]